MDVQRRIYGSAWRCGNAEGVRSEEEDDRTSVGQESLRSCSVKVSACRLCLGCWGGDLLRQDKRWISVEREQKSLREMGVLVSVCLVEENFQGDGPFLDLVFGGLSLD